MKSRLAFTLLSLFPLGCGGAASSSAEPATPSAPVATEVAVVDLNAASPPAAPVGGDAEQGKQYGMIGQLNNGSDPNAPTTPQAGNKGAAGNIWGDGPGDSFGYGGLGQAGIGEGGGGRGEGIGLGNIGVMGSGTGTGTGTGLAIGSGGGPKRKPPNVLMGTTTVSGRLPPEVIQRIVRANFGRLRLCYENGLRNNPTLSGKIAVRFEITPKGEVSTAKKDAGTDLADDGVVGCVVRVFSGMSFPEPDGGKVVVIFPIMFAPGELVPPAAATPAKPPPAPPKAPAPAPAKKP